MARGGYRPGAGRPKGSGADLPDNKGISRQEIPAAAAAEELTPLEYMLRVMNDRAADEARRDRMAVAAAPYVHGKVAEQGAGKKEQKERAAEEAARGRFAPPPPPKAPAVN